MKTLNLSYYENTSIEVKNKLEKITCMTIQEVCNAYSLDPDDVNDFIRMMEEDYETLLSEEEQGYYVDDSKEEYAQLYNFL